MDAAIEIRPLPAGALADAKALLVTADLPVDDLEDPAIALTGAFVGGDLVGVVGLQTCGDVGLLRSLVVAGEQRGRGTARLLCEHVFADTATRRLGALYLLTTSAADYFARLGFVTIERDAAPAAIRESAQFASLCPASARVMRR